MTDLCSGLSRFTASSSSHNQPGLGITTTAPTYSGLVRTKEVYGSLLQLVVVCESGINLEAYGWEKLNIVLSDVMHPLVVDICSDEEFAEDAEAKIQARIPSTMVHLHAIHAPRGLWHALDIVWQFWKRIDGEDETAGPLGS